MTGEAVASRSSSTQEPDVVVLGGGSAGFAAAIHAADLGARVTLIEGGTLGGTCVNVGCVPSKTLLRTAEIRHRAGHHPFEGVHTAAEGLDFRTVIDSLCSAILVEKTRALILNGRLIQRNSSFAAFLSCLLI